jgi:AraC-like DNA-binding protein
MKNPRNRPERLSLDLSRSGIPHLKLLGRLQYPRARGPLREHAHRDCIEICCLERGRQTYIVNNRSYRLTGGDVFYTLPGETHGSGENPEEKSILYWFICDIKSAGAFLGFRHHEAERLRKRLGKPGPRLFRGSRNLIRHLDLLITALQGNSPTGHIEAQCQAFHFLKTFLELAETASGRPASRMDSVIAHIRSLRHGPTPLPTLAELAGLSLSRFKQRFKEETGIPPGEFVLRERIEHAAGLLETTARNLTDIAFDAGWPSSQYFSTVFKRIKGMSPSMFRKRALRKSDQSDPSR